jgi:hypothetical protein
MGIRQTHKGAPVLKSNTQVAFATEMAKRIMVQNNVPGKGWGE